MVITRGARYGQLLLFVALLFGIATMHTVGHPSGHGSGQSLDRASTVSGHGAGRTPAVGPPHGSGLASTAAEGHSTGSGTGTGHGTGTGTGQESRPGHDSGRESGAGHDSGHVPDAHESVESQAPGHHGMDPASVCLAVLAACGVALLVTRLASRRPAGPVLVPALARVPHALWANGPPQKGVLARVSVLRI